MDPGFRKRLLVTQGGLVLVCLLSAVTAILALTLTNRTNGTLRETADDTAAVDSLRIRIGRLIAAGERVLLADDGLVRYREVEGDVERARQQLKARARDSFFVVDADSLDRGAQDIKVAIDHSANAPTADPRASFAAYRAALKPVRDAFDADAKSLVNKLVAHRNESSDRTTRVATRARWALAFTAAMAIAMSLAFAAGVMRALVRQGEKTRDAAAEAMRTVASRRELLAASKDLRGPISFILQAAKKLKEAPSEPLADDVQAAAETLRERIEELLDVSGVEAGTVDLRCERCDAKGLIDVAVRALQLLSAERAIHVRVLVPEPVLAYVDQRRIVQVLTSLIGMAIRSARPGGEVTIAARATQQGARFAISDTGAPMLPEHLMNLFERPVTQVIDPSSMGLYVSRRLVEAHGGRVGAEGNTVWFSLPTEPQLLREPSGTGASLPGVAS